MEELRFSVDSALLSELGEKLVETVHLAMEELIKNSYDADATNVIIKFTNDDIGKDEVHIIDNGNGMNLDDVKRYWMKIATTNKTTSNFSRKFGRAKTGSKGIGRFSCRRLGSELEMITIGKIDDKLEETHVFFMWDDFEPGTDITSINCPGETHYTSNKKTGTTLIIRNITEELKKRDYNFLKRQLAMLVANRGTKRKGYVEDPGFNIEIIAPQFEEKIINLREDLINSGWATVKAKVSNDGKAKYTLSAMGLPKKEIISNEIYKLLKGVTSEFGVLVGDRSQMRNTEVISKKRLQDILSDWGGIHVKYKGFRVYPYGSDDWLKIDHDRGLRKQKSKNEQLSDFTGSLKNYYNKKPLLNLLSEKNYIGEVYIDDPEKVFDMKANREGFIESDALEQLKKFVRFGVDWSTIYRDYYLKLKEQEKIEESRKHLEELKEKKIEPSEIIKESISYLKSQINYISTLIPEKEKKSLSNVNNVLNDVLQQNNYEREELKHLRLIASSSTALLLFTHEVKSLLGYLSNLQTEIIILKKKNNIDEVRNSLDSINIDIERTQERFSQLLDMLSLIIFESVKAEPMDLALKERIEQAINAFNLITEEYEIKIYYEEEVPNNLIVHNILEAELITILLNIISNSIKSIIANKELKKIEFSATRLNNTNIIKIRDTGVGINEEYFEEVFIPFVADPENTMYKKLKQNLNPKDKYLVGVGSGLGLSYIKEIIKNRNGSITFKKPPEGWNTELEIILP